MSVVWGDVTVLPRVAMGAAVGLCGIHTNIFIYFFLLCHNFKLMSDLHLLVGISVNL